MPNQDDRLKVEVKNPREIRPEFANGISIGFNENDFHIDFGDFISKDTVELVSRVRFSSGLAKQLIYGMAQAMQEYEEIYGKDLGLFSETETNKEDQK